MAVQIAGAQPDHWTRGPLHGCGFRLTLDDLASAQALWAIVGTWKGTRLWMRGHPVAPRLHFRVAQLLACLGQAVGTADRARYCASGLADRPGPVHIPCRLAMAYLPGLLETVLPGHPLALDAALATLADGGWLLCPLLDREAVERGLAAWQAGPLGPVDLDDLARRLLPP